jgi:RNA-directed DNA polymerase
LVNTDELEQVMVREAQLHALAVAERRVLEIQTKLHRWAGGDPHRRFDDLFNLVADPAFLLVGWDRVRNNRGARTAGVDGETAYYVETVRGLDSFLGELRGELKARTFQPLPARRRAIPKPGGKVRYLGIATIRDRVVQASVKLVLEPIFEADSSRAATGSARTDGPMTRWPRSTTSRPAHTSGSWKETSKPASTRSRTRP